MLGLQLVQVVSTEAPTAEEYVPTPQSTQALATVAPVVVRYLPARHSTHEAEPGILLYFPATQAAHCVFSPVYPGLQTQAAIAVCPVSACPEFGGQTSQTASDIAPVLSEYLLAAQLRHVLSLEAPVAVEYLPALQTAQLPCAVAPVFMRYLPALQSRHEAEPMKSLYFPIPQAVHGPPFGPVYPRLQRQLLERLLPLRDCEFPGQIVQVSTPIAPTTIE